jgi:hypothetical protein
MDWQEYQEATAQLYEQAEGLGEVLRNVYLPDRITGQKRQIDVLVEIKAKGHPLRMVIDAKYRKDRIDVKDVEEALALTAAVGANKCILVVANGWTKPAEEKARFFGADLVLLDMEDALDLVVADKWEVCPKCQEDCIVLEHEGFIEYPDGTTSVYIGGQCRRCRLAYFWCWCCGWQDYLDPGESHICDCGHEWITAADGLDVNPGAHPSKFDEEL